MKERLDDKLYLSFHRGEEVAFKVIFKLLFLEIRYFSFKLTSNMPEAEDITLTSFEKLFRMHKIFDNPNNIRAFLYTTATVSKTL
jgi:DNA-directed RNA polymerase specialized sigma24 family protein